jgi:hypothetical protein
LNQKGHQNERTGQPWSWPLVHTILKKWKSWSKNLPWLLVLWRFFEETHWLALRFWTFSNKLETRGWKKVVLRKVLLNSVFHRRNMLDNFCCEFVCPMKESGMMR